MKINHKRDKEVLLSLSKALNISKTHIRKDDLNYWVILGKEVWIDTDGELWYLHIHSSSVRKWTFCKKALEWMDLAVDGEDEGVLKAERMPDEKESRVIRKLLQLRQSYIPTGFVKIQPTAGVVQ